jgi:hypothetical protein
VLNDAHTVSENAGFSSVIMQHMCQPFMPFFKQPYLGLVLLNFYFLEGGEGVKSVYKKLVPVI